MDKNGPGLPSGRMSPPPSYDEVVFNVGETKKNINDNLSSYGIEFKRIIYYSNELDIVYRT